MRISNKEPVASIKTSIKLYPNPAVDFIHFESSSDLKIEKAILSDMYGNRVGIWPSPKHSISFPKVSSGIYLLQLETNNGIVIKKLSIL